MVELAFSLPIALPLFLGGAELANYAITRMRISQVALHVADNASRIGTDTLLAAPRISEAQINDLLTGANLQAGNLDLANRGRVILSSLEPDPDVPAKFMIHWQRCFGAMEWPSHYGDAGDGNLDGMGPVDRQATAPSNGATMFVEVAYEYEPLVSSVFVPSAEIVETGAMVVRDSRDYNGNGGTGIFNEEGVAPSDDC